MTRLRSCTFALRTRADEPSFGEARGVRSWMSRGIKTAVATAGAVLIAGSSSVFACPQCFGAEEASLVDGTKLGILVLLGITVAVQGAFGAFFLYLRRRAKRIAESDLDTEWSELQKVSR